MTTLDERDSVSSPRAVAIIPVRLESARLPGKAILAESGMALFLHTARQAALATSLAEVVVATDSEELASLSSEAGFRAILTSSAPRTGSERCAEALRSLRDASIVLDVQGDWPEIPPADLDRLVACLRTSAAPPIATLSCPLEDPADLESRHVVKLVCGQDGSALYFSRAGIPARKTGALAPEEAPPAIARRHLGVYGFGPGVLEELAVLPPSPLEEHEGLEQLRWLEAGLRIQVLGSSGNPRGIETREDYDAFVQRAGPIL